MNDIGKGTPIVGPARALLMAEVVSQYVEQTMPIRAIAEDTGRSYGAIHRLLIEAGVSLRSRGGAPRRHLPRT
jgi:hypothetical protein